MTVLDAARDHVNRGLRVFPIAPNSKVPAIVKFTEFASEREDHLKNWFQNKSNNVGVITDELVVIDVDKRKGGFLTFAALRQELELCGEEFGKTAAAETATGGVHFVFKAPPGQKIKGGANKLGSGVDIKARGGYIVGAGSTIDGTAYKWLTDVPIAPAPRWLLERLEKADNRKTAAAGERLVEEDDTAVELAERYLASAPRAEEGARDNTAFQVAAKLYDYGVSQDTCEQLLAQWNETNCAPPLDDDAIAKTARSAARNRDKAIGTDHPQGAASGFEPQEIAPRVLTEKPGPGEKPKSGRKFQLIRADEAARTALAHVGKPLVKGLLETISMSVLVGEPGSGKTFLELDIAYHIAKGLPWFGKKVTQGAVIYLAAEAGNSARRRMLALERHYGELGETPFYLIPSSADLRTSRGDAKELVALIRETEQRTSQKVVLLVVDTLNRVMAGGKETTSEDMGAVVAAGDYIRDQAKVHVSFVHHPPKDGRTTARGHSSLEGAADTVLYLGRHTLTAQKQKDGEIGDIAKIRLKQINIGEDEDGEAITSCYVEMMDPKAAVTFPVGSREQQILDCIDTALKAEVDKNRVFDVAWVQKACRKRGSRKGVSRTNLVGFVGKLADNGHLKKLHDNQYVRVRDVALSGLSELSE